MARTQQQTDDTAQARTIAEAMAALGKPITHTQALTVLAKLGGRKSRHGAPAAPATIATAAPEAGLPLRPFPVPRNVALATGLGGEDFDAWFDRHLAAAFPGERDIDVIPAGTTFGITTPGGNAGTFRALKDIMPAPLQALAKPLFDYTSKKSEMHMHDNHLGVDYSHGCAANETLQALLRHLYEDGFIEPADRVNLHFDTDEGGRFWAYQTDANDNAKFHYQHGMDDYDVANPPDAAELEQPEITITGRLMAMSRNSSNRRTGTIDVATPTDRGSVTFLVPDVSDRDLVVLTSIPDGATVSLTGRLQQGTFLVTKAKSKGFDLVRLRGTLITTCTVPGSQAKTGVLRVVDGRSAKARPIDLRIADITHWSVRNLANAEIGGAVTLEGILHGSTLTVTWASAR